MEYSEFYTNTAYGSILPQNDEYQLNIYLNLMYNTLFYDAKNLPKN